MAAPPATASEVEAGAAADAPAQGEPERRSRVTAGQPGDARFWTPFI